ncbi:MAG: mechanosensitive ion channel domain-containing protein [Planctomycetota bacterium]
MISFVPILSEATDPEKTGGGDTSNGTLTFTEFIRGVGDADTNVLFQAVNQWLLPAIMVVGVMLIGYLVASYLSRICSTPIRKRVDETLGIFVGKLTFYLIMLGFAGVVLHRVGFEITTVATVLTAAGFAVGLAFQGTLSNFAAGIMLMIFRPFKVGDFVKAADVAGTINEIDLFSTTLDTPDNRRLIVPNSSIFSGTIENVSHHAHRRVDVAVGVSYDADIDDTRAALDAAVQGVIGQNVPGDDRGYTIVLTELNASSVDWVVRFWCNKADYWGVREQLIGHVKRSLDAAQISIPYPQMDVHLYDPEAANEQQAHLQSSGTADPLNADQTHVGDGAGIQEMVDSGRQRPHRTGSMRPRVRPQRRSAS